MLAESLKRLYEKGKVTDEKLENMKAEQKITEEEFNSIVSDSTGGDNTELKTFYDEVIKEVGISE